MGKNPAQKAKTETKEKVAPKKVTAQKAPSKKKLEVSAASSESLHCAIAKCKRPYRAKSYCNVHYKKWKRGEYGLARYKTCGFTDCKKPIVVNRFGLCEDHYQSKYVKGEVAPKAAPAQKPAAAPSAEDKTSAA